ncbi:hypothetical protein [Streptomyces sp. NPDC047841]|uniref:hypothetical protein n=1 Tax=Streptomyces sp. NPDC047841 TaxID=3154708 RepID=UPI00345299F2
MALGVGEGIANELGQRRAVARAGGGRRGASLVLDFGDGWLLDRVAGQERLRVLVDLESGVGDQRAPFAFAEVGVGVAVWRTRRPGR